MAGSLIASPLHIEGEARGSWYFEASFPIQLLDANGKQLGVTTGQAQSDWMTPDLVPFQADLKFSTPTTTTGKLILKKDNPSGLPENEAEQIIPVRFK